jgi:hypothetical protein
MVVSCCKAIDAVAVVVVVADVAVKTSLKTIEESR